ncbi:MAG TPA: 4a-hydroxytetrahydrobiopterin dehydratase [Thermoanaerobaculia bacterium]|nr:4a-hydroxytetrahydrobiopterin dehydratase [Thermoanaerobaculia bacterium]
MAAEPLDSEHDLAAEQCVPCRGGVPPLSEEVAAKLLGQLADGWRLVSNHHLERSWTFPDFRRALAFTNQIGDLAELQGHHPDITLKWGSVAVVIWTHAIDGLTRSDFVLAAKIDGLARI